MAYVTDTIASAGQATALKGYIMNGSLTNWTKHPRRIEWNDVVKLWNPPPTVEQLARAKAHLPKEPLT